LESYIALSFNLVDGFARATIQAGVVGVVGKGYAKVLPIEK